MLQTESHAVSTGIPSSTLAVIGGGLGRTGTLSLHAALERLGFAPCDHMTNNFTHPERFALWLEAARRKRAGEPIDWRPLFAGYRATVDWPGVYFWRELTAAHPDAKVILTVRGPECWYDSARATIYAASQARDEDLSTRLIANLLAWLDPRAGHGFRVVQETVWDGTFGGQFADRETALRIFAAHNREVEATIPRIASSSSTSSRAGNRCAPSSACRSPKGNHSPTSTTPPISAEGSRGSICGLPGRWRRRSGLRWRVVHLAWR